jgi:multidrug efflux pump subunit AcrB
VPNNPDGNLRAGMSTDVVIQTAHAADAVVVPQGALIQRNGQQFVFTNVDGRAKMQVVQTGLANASPQSLDQLKDIAENQIKRAFEAVPGVSSVSMAGAPTREIWVKADLNKLQARGLSLTSILQALQSSQLQQPAGTVLSDSKDASVVLKPWRATRACSATSSWPRHPAAARCMSGMSQGSTIRRRSPAASRASTACRPSP